MVRPLLHSSQGPQSSGGDAAVPPAVGEVDPFESGGKVQQCHAGRLPGHFHTCTPVEESNKYTGIEKHCLILFMYVFIILSVKDNLSYHNGEHDSEEDWDLQGNW